MEVDSMNLSRSWQSLTPRQLATLVVVLPIGGAAAVLALLGNMRVATALLAALVTIATLATLQLRRRVAAAQVANKVLLKDVRTVVEQTQRRLVAAVEHERVAGADRQKVLLNTLQRGHRQAERGALLQQRAQTREIEALLQLFRDVTPRAPMPSSGDFALNPTDLLELLYLVDERRPELVVELGSGTSTVWLAYALEKFGGRLVSYDHDAGYAARTRALLAAHGLEAVAEVREAALRPVSVDGADQQWYDTEQMQDLSDIDLLLVDGPPESTGDQARFPALPVLASRLSPTATVILDDANRDGEQEALRRWTESVPGLTKDHEILGRHAVLSYRRPITTGAESLTSA
jgi:predicted O-methyltransferase YrrM